MPRILLLLLLVSATGLAAQQSFLDASVGVHYAFRRLTDSDPPSGVNRLAENEQGVITGSVGFHYGRQLGDRLALRTGLRLMTLGYGFRIDGLRWGSQFDGQGGFDPGLDPDAPAEVTGRNDRIFLDVPLLVRYAMHPGRWKPYVEAGLLPGAYLTTRTEQRAGDERTVEYRDGARQSIHRVQLGAALSLGVSYGLSGRYALFLQGSGRYQLTPLADGPYRERPYAGGLEVGLRRNLP